MRLYRVGYVENARPRHKGFSWHALVRDANRAASRWRRPGLRWANVTPVDVKLTRAAILEFLKKYGSYPDNG